MIIASESAALVLPRRVQPLPQRGASLLSRLLQSFGSMAWVATSQNIPESVGFTSSVLPRATPNQAMQTCG